MIQKPTDPGWVKLALQNFDALLADHAHCEKKAAATALSLVASYPDCDRLVRKLSLLAIEELRHFRAVHRLLRKRGKSLTQDGGDAYVKALLQNLRHTPEERRMDRLLVAALIEARSHERLSLLADALEDLELGVFYRSLASAEKGHAWIFVELARELAGTVETDQRLETLAVAESEALASVKPGPRIH